MRQIYLLALLFMCACAPSKNAIQATETPRKSAPAAITAKPSDTPQPTAAAEPSPTQAPQANLDELRQQLLSHAREALLDVADVDHVTLVQLRDGALEIELTTKWPGRIRQAALSFTAVRVLAERIVDVEQDKLDAAVGGPLVISLKTYSAEGEYRYCSITDWGTIERLAANSVTYEEWVSLANGGFR